MLPVGPALPQNPQATLELLSDSNVADRSISSPTSARSRLWRWRKPCACGTYWPRGVVVCACAVAVSLGSHTASLPCHRTLNISRPFKRCTVEACSSSLMTSQVEPLAIAEVDWVCVENRLCVQNVLPRLSLALTTCSVIWLRPSSRLACPVNGGGHSRLVGAALHHGMPGGTHDG